MGCVIHLEETFFWSFQPLFCTCNLGQHRSDLCSKGCLFVLIVRIAYLVEEGLDVCLEGGAGLHDELLGEHEGVLALGLLRLDDVDEDDVEQLVGDEVGLRDQRRQHVQHERFHLPGVLVAARIKTFIFEYKNIMVTTKVVMVARVSH